MKHVHFVEVEGSKRRTAGIVVYLVAVEVAVDEPVEEALAATFRSSVGRRNEQQRRWKE